MVSYHVNKFIGFGFESTKLASLKYKALPSYVKLEKDVPIFERFFEKLLESIYLQSSQAFKKEIKVEVMVDRRRGRVSMVCSIRNSIGIQGIPRFLLFLPTQGGLIRKNLMDLFDVKAIFSLVILNWVDICARIYDHEKKNINLIDLSHDEFLAKFKLLFQVISETRR